MTGLFGDAIYLDIPSTYRDVSEFRQVPDNQEVFVDQSSNDSLLVEIMEMVSFSQDHGNFGEYVRNS